MNYDARGEYFSNYPLDLEDSVVVINNSDRTLNPGDEKVVTDAEDDLGDFQDSDHVLRPYKAICI